MPTGASCCCVTHLTAIAAINMVADLKNAVFSLLTVEALVLQSHAPGRPVQSHAGLRVGFDATDPQRAYGDVGALSMDVLEVEVVEGVANLEPAEAPRKGMIRARGQAVGGLVRLSFRFSPFH